MHLLKILTIIFLLFSGKSSTAQLADAKVKKKVVKKKVKRHILIFNFLGENQHKTKHEKGRLRFGFRNSIVSLYIGWMAAEREWLPTRE